MLPDLRRRPVPFLALLLAALALPPAASAAIRLPQGFAAVQVATGLQSPTAMAFAPDGRIFVCEQAGRLRVIKDGALLPEPFLRVPVNTIGERGLDGVVLDPEFATNGWVYVYYTAFTPTLHNRLSRFTADGDVAVPGSETILIEFPNLVTNIHNGGAMHFGPDGKLYLAVGENGRSANAQNLANPLGKVLRLNPDGTVPNDGPFFGSTSGVSRAIWAFGLRNPFTFAFQRGTGRMFINDVGQTAWEEVNDGIAGSNYGWPATEGPTTDPHFRGPIHAYRHIPGPTGGCAITGGAFYDPEHPQFPAAYAGTYFFADFCKGWIHRLDPAHGNTVADFASGFGFPVDLDVTPDGSLYVLVRDPGSVFRIEHTASRAPRIAVQPADLTVSVGQAATFRVEALGVAPLRYQWRRDGADIPGATAAAYTLPAAALADDGASFRVVVKNAFGSDTSDAATLTVTTDRPPAAIITAPANGTLYRGDDLIAFAGAGEDPEEGALPASAFTWQIDFHHDTHTHPFYPPTSGIASGSVRIPATGETSANVFYRIHLTVRDSLGLAGSTFVDVVPRKGTIQLRTDPPGLRVTLDGQPVTTPASVVGVVGIVRTLGVVSPQSAAGAGWVFDHWSDGRPATHNIRTRAGFPTYTAHFRPASGAGEGIGLAATYFAGRDLTGPAVVRVDPTVDGEWGTGAPATGIPPDRFSVRWTGQVEARVSGVHTFYTLSDDGVRLWIDGVKVIDHWAKHPPAEDRGTRTLVAGRRYDVRMEYYDETGGAIARLSWSAPGLAKEVVPQGRLHPYALLVAGSAALSPGDAAVRGRLAAAGWVPVVKSAGEALPAHAAGTGVALFSSSVDPARVRPAFRDSVVPVVAWDPGLFAVLRMTDTAAGTDFGTVPGLTQVDVAPLSHPLAAGLSGLQPVAAAPAALGWGRPTPAATVVARLPTADGPAALFAYDRGTAMSRQTAPARRVGLFLGDAPPALTGTGWALFDAAVRWASGQ